MQPTAPDLLLDGDWELGLDRKYTSHVMVPGLAQSPAVPSPGTLWYRREVKLPAGEWTQAVLTLGGARFAPHVYVNGVQVSAAEGGMAPTVHLLRSAQVQPGRTITLEIALKSLTELDPKDASMVPQADRWRSDNSSGLWDSAVLHFTSAARITHTTPFVDFHARRVAIHWALDKAPDQPVQMRVTLLGTSGQVLANALGVPDPAGSGILDLQLPQTVQTWEPTHPVVYRLRVAAMVGGRISDAREFSWGLRSFQTRDRRFFLNDHPIELRGGTVVWHRFMRFPEAQTLAWDTTWFETNVTSRLKNYGANLLRFHLGLPPERLLDLCDREGLMVQMEWPFFHGVKASDASMREQWHAWLDVAMRHPSVVIVHPWNETEGDELKAAWKAMNAVLEHYPPLVVAHRDTLHIHKYWWSLFENLGLYYDSANQFDTTVMVDEFGGNYLNQQGDAGLYPAVKETFLRFLGRTQTRPERLEFQAESNARVAEYWRRLGVAGIAPFCILGSPEDGSSWFLGDLTHPRPMPVWDELAAAFAPQSLSLDVWDRNYTPGEHVTLPVYFFNDTGSPATLHAEVRIVAQGSATSPGKPVSAQTVEQTVPAWGRSRASIQLHLPSTVGSWRFEGQLTNRVEGVSHPIISAWDFRTVQPAVPSSLAGVTVAVPAADAELKAFLVQNGLRTVAPGDPSAKLAVVSGRSLANAPDSASLQRTLQTSIGAGTSVVLLDLGPRDLGQGYRKGDLGPLDGAPRVLPGTGYTQTLDLFSGIRLTFHQVAEPESHFQPGPADASLWSGLPPQSAWLWNGLRAGLVAPAADMEISGLGAQGFVAEWVMRGADPARFTRGEYFAYQLAGYYAFSDKPNDADTIKALRKRVAFLVEDAPALGDVINPAAKIEQTDLSAGLREHASGQAEQLISLATCGKSLVRTGVAELVFGAHRGNVILSQALTAGRLVRGHAEPGFYGVRYDPAAEQMVLNMLAKALAPASAMLSLGPPHN